MSSFTAPAILEIIGKRRDGAGMFRIHKPFTYEIGSLGSGNVVTVPAGFDTDLCSVPRLARPFIMQAGSPGKAAILHDWLLSTKDPRANNIFSEALRVAGVTGFTHWLLVAAVRAWTA